MNRKALTWSVMFVWLSALPVFALQAAPAKTPRPAAQGAAGAGAPVNLNTASEGELEALPGVGAATAKKIIAGRPYASVTDLARAGVPKNTIEKITPMVTAAGGATAPARPAPPVAKAAPAASPRSTASSGGTVNVNSASESELEALPGVGPATAKKIIAGRPYASVADLTKAGVTKATLEKISPMVSAGAGGVSASVPPARSQPAPTNPTASSAPPARPTAPAPAPATPPAPTTSTGARTTSAPLPAQQPPVKGMVWVNLDTKVFHREGDRYYGRTKNGKFMSEADALAAGYRASKTPGTPKL